MVSKKTKIVMKKCNIGKKIVKMARKSQNLPEMAKIAMKKPALARKWLKWARKILN